MGTLLCGVIGISCQLLGATGGYDLFGWFSAMGNGIIGMGELVIIAMMAGGMLEIIRENGGINYIIDKITAHVSNKRVSRTVYCRTGFHGQCMHCQQYGCHPHGRQYSQENR